MIFTSYIFLFSLAILTSAAKYKRVTCPDGVNTATNAACCTFFSIAEELQENVFQSTCGTEAKAVLRLAFQDAIGFSSSGGRSKGTGADGSIMLFPEELEDPANVDIEDGIDDIAFLLQRFDVSAGDLIQFAAAVGLTNCMGAPRLEFRAGRPNATVAAASGLIPLPEDNVNTIFARVEDAGFSPTELVSLLAAHSIGRTDSLVDNRQDVPFDTTPFTFDTQFYLEVLLRGNETLPASSGQAGAQVPNALAAEGAVRLQSDFVIANSPQTACFWQTMVNNQQVVQGGFQEAMAKLALVGQDTSILTDCSEAVPFPASLPPGFKSASFPAGTGPELLQLGSCPEPPECPYLTVDPGQPTTIPVCPDGDTNLNDCPSA